MSEYLIKNKSSVVNSLEIKKIRKDNGLTLKEFATSIEVSLSTVQKWESGERNPSKQMLFFIKNKYNIETVKEEEEEEDLKLMFMIKLYKEQKKTNELLSKLLKK